MSDLTGTVAGSNVGASSAPSGRGSVRIAGPGGLVRTTESGGLVRTTESGGFAPDVHSITIRTRQRTFYIDLKESANGRFLKVSEKSRGGQKSTIMFDAEDLDQFIAAFQEMKGKLA